MATGVIHGATEVGSDLGAAAKGIIIGVLHGTRETAAQALDKIGHTSASVIRTTAEVGGDLGAAAKGLVEGAIHGARDLGVSAERAAAAAANGALDAAGSVSSTAAEEVRKR